MDYQQDLMRLEGIIEKLMTAMDKLRKEKQALIATVNDRDQEISRLQNERNGLETDRSSILDRVNQMIGTIEEWENSDAQAAEPQDAANEESGQLDLL